MKSRVVKHIKAIMCFICLTLMFVNVTLAESVWKKAKPECSNPTSTSFYNDSRASDSLLVGGYRFAVGKRGCNRGMYDFNLIENDEEEGIRAPGIKTIRSSFNGSDNSGQTAFSFMLMFEID